MWRGVWWCKCGLGDLGGPGRRTRAQIGNLHTKWRIALDLSPSSGSSKPQRRWTLPKTNTKPPSMKYREGLLPCHPLYRLALVFCIFLFHRLSLCDIYYIGFCICKSNKKTTQTICVLMVYPSWAGHCIASPHKLWRWFEYRFPPIFLEGYFICGSNGRRKEEEAQRK